MASGITCIVTIHGIGFQQPPTPGVPPAEDMPGYADDLHSRLCNALNQDGQVLLGDDPCHQSYQGEGSVPIYVQSVWPPKTACREDGIKRLGSWNDTHRATISHDETQALVKGNARIAHVALVYSGLEGQTREAEAAFNAGVTALLFARRYSNFMGTFHEIFQDAQPFAQSVEKNLLDHLPWRPSLCIRQDQGGLPPNAPNNASSPREAFLTVLENDVATYVCHNGRRQRVRSFVQDALLRLACRDDVSGIILNTHSNGTVIGLDVVAELPPFASEKIRAVITAGSPIRKYVDLFSWGQHLAVMPKIGRWWNFWDEKDIVADPLRPYAHWMRGKDPVPAQLPPEQLVGIYQALDPTNGEITPMPIQDILVDNITNSLPGGMQAHNYWDNTKDFIAPVARLLKEVVAAD